MPRERATTTKLLPPEDEERVPVLDEADEQEQDDIEGVISQVADEAATVQVKRWNPAPDDPGKPWDYITTVAAREFNLEAIKREYGGGRYKAVTLDRSRRYVKGGTHLFSIDKMFKPAPPRIEAPLAAGAPVNPDVTALRDEVRNLAALLQAQSSTKDTLDLALKIAAVMGGKAAAGIGPDTVFNIFEKGLEFSRKLGGGDYGDDDDRPRTDDDVYATAIKELVRPVASLIQSEVERRAKLQGPVRVALPPGGPSWVAQLRPFIPQLLTLARENADPELYADVVYDLMERKLPAAQLHVVEGAATEAGFVDSVVTALPAPCAPFTGWFRSLAEHLKAAMTAPPSPGDDDDDDDDRPRTSDDTPRTMPL